MVEGEIRTQLGAFAENRQKTSKGKFLWFSSFFAGKDTNFGFGRTC